MKILQSMCRNVFEYRRKVLSLLPVVPPNRFCCSQTGNGTLRIMFFGTDNFSLPSLRILNENLIAGGTVSSLEVVTSFKAKKNPLKQYAQEKELKVYDWPLQRPNVDNDFDIGVVVSFGHMIPGSLIASFRLGMLNVHASLLPKLRGAAPIVHAIKNGETETGVTIMKIKPKHFDVGEILTQRKVPITRDMLMPELHSQLAEIGASTLLHCIESLDHYYANLKGQNCRDATYAPKIDPLFADIRWSEMSARQIYDLYRSLYSYKPLTTHLGKEMVKIFKLSYDDQQPSHTEAVGVGQIKYCRKRKRLRVCCSDGMSVDIEQLSIGGKKPMSAQEFNNGFLSKLKPEDRCLMNK